MKLAIKKCSVNDCGFVPPSPEFLWNTFNGAPVCPFHFERLTNPPVNALAIRIASIHGTLLKLGPRLGGPFVKLIAYYAMYRIFTSGGVESVAYVCYEHMLRTADAEKEKAKKKHGPQSRVRKNKRP